MMDGDEKEERREQYEFAFLQLEAGKRDPRWEMIFFNGGSSVPQETFTGILEWAGKRGWAMCCQVPSASGLSFVMQRRVLLPQMPPLNIEQFKASAYFQQDSQQEQDDNGH